MNTEQPDVDSTNLEGAGGNQPPVSQGQGNSIEGKQQTSHDFLELKKIIDQQGKELRGLQSRQDKETNEVQRFMNEVKAYTSKGKSLEEAEQAVYADREVKQKDELLYKIAQKVGVLDDFSQNVTGNNNNVTNDVAQVFNKYNLDMNDPAVVPLLSLSGDRLRAEVADYAYRKSQIKPSDSSEAGSIPGSPAPQVDQSSLVVKLRKLQANPAKNQSEILKLEKELGW